MSESSFYGKIHPTEEQLEHFAKTGSLILEPEDYRKKEEALLKKFLAAPPPIISLDPPKGLSVDSAELEKFMKLPIKIIDPGAHKRFTDPHIEHIMPIELLSFEVRDDSVITRKRVKLEEAFKWHTPAPAPLQVRIVSDVDEEWEFDLASGKIQIGDVVHTKDGQLCTVTAGGLISIANTMRESGAAFPMKSAVPPGRGLLDQISAPDWSKAITKDYKPLTRGALEDAMKAFDAEPAKDMVMHTGKGGFDALRKAVGMDDFTIEDLVHQPDGKLKEMLQQLLDEEQTYDMDPEDVTERRIQVSRELERRLEKADDEMKKLFRSTRIGDHTVHTRKDDKLEKLFFGPPHRHAGALESYR